MIYAILSNACFIVGTLFLVIHLFGGPENFSERGLLLIILGWTVLNYKESK